MKTLIECTAVGHATTVIRIGSSTVITDPHFSRRCGIFARVAPLAINPGDLPDPACILLSHTHIDHFDPASYKYISCGIPIIVPEGCEPAVSRHLPNPVIELTHYARHELPCGAEITALPVVHSKGHLVPYGKNHANAYFIRQVNAPGCVLFCGDSAAGPHFREIGNLGPIDIALLPIGSYSPRFLMQHHHINPAEAITAFEELRARHLIPIHHGTFRLSFERPQAPAQWIEKILAARPDLASRVHLLASGQSFSCEVQEGGNVVSIERKAV